MEDGLKILLFDGCHTSEQRLSELLKSKKPEDLQEANRLIKNMVKEVRLSKGCVLILTQRWLPSREASVNLTQIPLCLFPPQDEVRTQKAVKLKSTLEAVSNSVKVLNEMLAHFSPDESTREDKELIKVRSCTIRPRSPFEEKHCLCFLP